MAGLKVSRVYSATLLPNLNWVYSFSPKVLGFFNWGKSLDEWIMEDALMRNRAISEAGWLTDGRCCILTNQSAAFCSCPDVPWTPQQLHCWRLPRKFNILRFCTFKANADSKSRSFSTCEKFNLSIISLMHAVAKGDKRRNMLDRWILEKGQDTDWHTSLGNFFLLSWDINFVTFP